MAKFSRQHYQILAKALREALEACKPEQCPGVGLAARHIGNELAYDNASFNYQHFMAVVRGEREPSSKPPRSKTQGDGRYSHSRPWED